MVRGLASPALPKQIEREREREKEERSFLWEPGNTDYSTGLTHSLVNCSKL